MTTTFSPHAPAARGSGGGCGEESSVVTRFSPTPRTDPGECHGDVPKWNDTHGQVTRPSRHAPETRQAERTDPSACHAPQVHSSHPATTEASIARVAARQHGVISRGQLVGLGLTDAAIYSRCRRGRLHRVHHGVYAVGYIAATALAQAMAAVLACGERTALSHRSAAALWELGVTARGAVDVITPQHRHHRGVVIHRSRTLTAQAVTTHHGIRVTTPLRTLIDLADVADDRSLARAMNEALLQKLVRQEEVAAALDGASGRRALRRLRALVERADTPTRSVLEDAVLAFVDRYALPRPTVNQRVAGFEVDMLWRAKQLIVELDGRAVHDRSQSFEDDRERDAELTAAGFRVVRVTWQRLRDHPGREAERLGRLLTS